MGYSEETPALGVSRSLREASFVSRTYGWMFFGLLVTALTSFGIASSEDAARLFLGNRILFYGAMIAELGLVIGISAGIKLIGVWRG